MEINPSLMTFYCDLHFNLIYFLNFPRLLKTKRLDVSSVPAFVGGRRGRGGGHDGGGGVAVDEGGVGGDGCPARVVRC